MTFIAGNGGFTLDGIPAKELYIIMGHDSDRPVAPSTVDRLMSIPGRNGMLDFGADTGARYFNLTCNIITRNYLILQSAIERIASILLDGYGRPRTLKLVFDARPDRYYLVRYSGSLSIERMFGYGSFTLPLVTIGQPFARSLDSSEGIILDSDVLLDSDILLDDEWSYTVNGSTELNIDNWGTMIVKPIIEVSGSFSNLMIMNNGKTLNYNAALVEETLVINSERMTIREGNKNMLGNMTGDFIELSPGKNNISITGTSLNADVSFVFQASYF